MAKIDLNQAEQDLITHALDKALASAKRQQNTSPNPQIRQIYATEERNLLAIQMKIADAK